MPIKVETEIYTEQPSMTLRELLRKPKLTTSKLQANDSRGLWEGLRQITNCSSTVPVVSEDPKLPNSLNEFYCRFDKDGNDAPTQPKSIKTPSPPFVIQEDEVRRLLKKQNGRKAAGPDLLSSATIKHCVDELTPVLTDMFN